MNSLDYRRLITGLIPNEELHLAYPFTTLLLYKVSIN